VTEWLIPDPGRADDNHAVPASGKPIGIGLVLLLVAGTLAVGLAFRWPCAVGDWNDGRPFTRGCYTDLVGLIQSEKLTGNRLPYLDPCEGVAEDGTCDEYPVITMWTMRVAAWASGPSTTRFFFANAVLVFLAAFWTALCLRLMVGRRVLYFALAPTLALAATNNWDLIAVGLMTAATLAYLRRRDVWSGVLLGLGAAAKLFPALLVIPFVAGRFRGREPDRGTYLAWAAAGTWVALNIPFAIWGTSGWMEFFQNSKQRGASWNSLWFTACKLATGQGCTRTGIVNVASLVLFVAWVGIVWYVKARRDPGFARWTLGFPILILFLLSNKVYSPQFSLWLLPWFALALPNLRLFIAFEAADVIVFLTEFGWLGHSNGITGGLTDVPTGVFELMVVVRAAILVLCVVAWVRRREPAPSLAEPIVSPEPSQVRQSVPV
jgi:Glycosyltransferase family 87